MIDPASRSTLTPDELDAYRRLDSTTLFFARAEIEGFISEDFTGPELRVCYPDLGPAVGYAVTSEWTTMDPEAPEVDLVDYYEWFANQPGPKLAVMMDVDRRAGRGSGLGEMQARTLRRLGCTGIVAGVGLHDVDAVRALSVPVWTTGIAPAHGPYHIVRHGAPVTVAQMTWHTGDLVFADASGAIRIPRELGRDVLNRAVELVAKDKSYFAVIDAPDFSFANLRAWLAGHRSIYPPVDAANRERWWARNGSHLAPRDEGRHGS
jgi:4-hydroxy-4-methyl-2-oxoglutarate aldolase